MRPFLRDAQAAGGAFVVGLITGFMPFLVQLTTLNNVCGARLVVPVHDTQGLPQDVGTFGNVSVVAYVFGTLGSATSVFGVLGFSFHIYRSHVHTVRRVVARSRAETALCAGSFIWCAVKQ